MPTSGMFGGHVNGMPSLAPGYHLGQPAIQNGLRVATYRSAGQEPIFGGPFVSGPQAQAVQSDHGPFQGSMPTPGGGPSLPRAMRPPIMMDTPGYPVVSMEREEIRAVAKEVMQEMVTTIANDAIQQLAAKAVEICAERVVQQLLSKHQSSASVADEREKKCRKVPRDVTRAAHVAMRRLMGCRMKTTSSDPRLKPYYKLPDPLAPRASRRTDPDGAPLWNPDWNLSVDEGVNVDFISAVVDLVQQNGAREYQLKPEHAEDTDLIQRAALTYFRQLRRQYKYRKDEQGRKKLRKKHANDKHGSRRQRKADFLRKGVKGFRKAFGKTRTVGVQRLIHPPWQSDECSSDGRAGHAERERVRSEQGAGRNALERRHAAWRSRKINLMYIALAVFALYRQVYESENSSNSDLPSHVDSDDSTSESELSESEQKAYLEQVIAAVRNGQLNANTSSSAHRAERFHGPPANAQLMPHKRHGVPIYRECLSRKWRKTHPEYASKFANAPACPASFTVMTLDIPESLVPEEEQGFLADTEDEGEGAD
ncbi:hypothetical protein C8Q77DRAFT_1162010 [Trametes polyzona]|nr:hypothetical protein C8Q77DRAFT_1162010 [Trametes polyzona]